MSTRLRQVILLILMSFLRYGVGYSQETLGPEFQNFLDRIVAASEADRQSIADSFLTVQPSFPVVEADTIVYYIYKGDAVSVHVPGDANGWNAEAFPMTNIANTNVWYSAVVFEADARLDYKFVIDGTSWILDPRNSLTITGGFGPNSELRMPEFEFPEEINYRPEIEHGSFMDTTLTSAVLGNTRTIQVYLPPRFNINEQKKYPTMVFHDGTEFLDLANAANVIDHLIHEKRINPIIGIFVPPVDRDNEYAWNNTANFESFITEEMLPALMGILPISTLPEETGMMGVSYGGVITFQICYNRPDIFGLAAPLSTAFWARNQEVYSMVKDGQKKNIKWYIDWGSYEGTGITELSKNVKDAFIEKGYDVSWNEWHDGHSWGNWRGHIDNALEYLFPNTGTTSNRPQETELPKTIKLHQNYPNPFNPSTRIRYTLSEASYVTIKIDNALGQTVATLEQGQKRIGTHTVEFNGSELSSGIYFYTIKAGSFTETKKMLLVK